MSDWLLQVDGVNFSTTLDDTQDLSTRRGASLALLNAKDEVLTFLTGWLQETAAGGGPKARLERIHDGASQVLVRLTGLPEPYALKLLSALRQHLRTPGWYAPNEPVFGQQGPPVPVMTFVADLVREDGKDALALLWAKLRRAQFQTPTLRPHAPVRGQAAPCQFEHRLPADEPHSVRKDMLPRAQIVRADPEHDEKEVLAARSVAWRRSYGRTARQRFYAHLLGDGVQRHFADGLVDLVARPPADLPQALQNRIAVIAADGIGFGNLLADAQAASGELPGLAAFSKEVSDAHRKGLLKPLLQRFDSAFARSAAAGGDGREVSIPWQEADNPKARRNRWSPILRFETLTYAGDDICWLVPGWLAWEVAEFMLSAAAGLCIAGQAPQYRIGIAVVPCRMPIRKARSLAEELAYKATSGDRTTAAVQVAKVESIDVSDGHLDRHRRRIAGDRGDAAFTIDGVAMAEVRTHVRRLSERGQGGFPRSQLYRLLGLATRLRAFEDPDGAKAVAEDLKRTLDRGGYRFVAGDDPLKPEHFASPLLNAAGDPLFGMLRLAELSELVLPLGRPMLSADPAPAQAAAS